MTAREALLSLSLKYEGNWDRMYKALKEKEPAPLELVGEYERNGGANFITITDEDYPTDFRYLNRPPLLIYYKGDLSLLKNKESTLAYIGSRDASSYGLSMAKKIVMGFVENDITICTGLARGIDAEAAKTALDCGGKLIAVLGNGIDFCYPSKNQELYERAIRSGLVLSEYPLLTAPAKENFPARNRIVAGLSKAVLVGEASRRSGTLITVQYALSISKDVGCVPYRADSESSCNMLIKDGAYLIENVEDALWMMGKRERKGFSQKISEML